MTTPNPKRLKMETPPAKKAPRDNGSNTSFDRADSVTLVVGSEKHELLAHANFLTQSSEFFRAALKKEWLECQTRIIHLHKEFVYYMAVYLRFLYAGDLPRYDPCDESSSLSSYETMYLLHVQIYALAHRLMDDTTKNAVLQEICKTFTMCHSHLGQDQRYSPGVGSTNNIYKDTMVGDPARRLVVDLHMLCPQVLDPKFDPTRRKRTPGRRSVTSLPDYSCSMLTATWSDSGEDLRRYPCSTNKFC
jgi:hypothetical protein